MGIGGCWFQSGLGKLRGDPLYGRVVAGLQRKAALKRVGGKKADIGAQIRIANLREAGLLGRRGGSKRGEGHARGHRDGEKGAGHNDSRGTGYLSLPLGSPGRKARGSLAGAGSSTGIGAGQASVRWAIYFRCGLVMLIVHHLNNSRSQRVLWLLEELGVPYEIKRYERDRKTMLAPPELRAVHPLGKSPVVVDDGQTIAESGAIIEYLIDRYGAGRLAPAPGTPERLRYTYWLHYAEGSAMPPLLLKLVASRIPTSPMPFFAKPIARKIAAKLQSAFVDPQLKLHLSYINESLAPTGWFVGDTFSAADIQMSFPLEAASARVGSKEQFPHIADFVSRIHQRPAYRRALERGGPYGLLS
jgi:glutathione S-transferase